MPILIVTLIIATVAGLFASRRVALAITGTAVALTMTAFVWTVADGLGNDPWWLLVIAVVGCSLAVAVADGLSRRRDAQRVSG